MVWSIGGKPLEARPPGKSYLGEIGLLIGRQLRESYEKTHVRRDGWEDGRAGERKYGRTEGGMEGLKRGLDVRTKENESG